jgi:hypothetical protein
MPRNPGSNLKQGRQRVLTPDEIREVHKLRESGKTFRAIGDTLEAHYVTVWRAYCQTHPDGSIIRPQPAPLSL